MNSKRSNRLPLRSCLAAAVMAGAFTVQSCTDDVLTGQPSWLGESIYEELQKQGNYTTMLRLIDDLGLTEQMSHTGSLTLFAADDETFNNWFQTNSWGVRSYSQLSQAQKQMLLYSEEINNAYLVELMSNLEADPPLTGRTMRRTNMSSVFDSVSTWHWQDMPNTRAWQWYRQNQKDIIVFKDGRMMSGTTTSNLSQPMIHFLPAFMQEKSFTDDDVRILTNGVATSTSDAFVSGHKITERDITCKNGYIHKMDGVITPLPNMAEIVRSHPVSSEWSRLLDRFCAPYYDRQKTIEYNRMFSAEVDSVFTLRYFADRRNSDGLSTQRLPPTQDNTDGVAATATLPFDPGWNQYKLNSQSSDMHEDAAAMIVPTNEALDRWWNADGRALQDMYGTWDNVPDVVVEPLLSVNMLSSFTSSIPSKFSSVLNDAQTELGITTADVDSVFMGCNGVVYLTNKVFSPMEYSSVTFPALIHQDIMSVIYAGVNAYSFSPYLNSMDSYYSLILPTNDALLYYLDPCTYGNTQPTLLAFSYDANNSTTHLQASRYRYTLNDDGTITLGNVVVADVTDNTIQNRMNDLINQMIIVGNVEDGHTYYKTKNGTPVRVDNGGKSNMTISGGWQLEHGNPTTVTEIFDQSATGNGKSYVVSSNIPQGASKSVYQTLQAHEEYSEFLKLLQGGDHMQDKDQILLGTQTLNRQPYHALNSDDGNSNISLFGNYNYTVYVPTNESIKALEDNGTLPTWEDYDEAFTAAGDQEDSVCVLIKNRILDFVKYHIQDNAVLIGLAPEEDSQGNKLNQNDYESMMLNPETNRYYPLGVYFDDDRLTVTDNTGVSHNVVKTNGLYNNICREYWLSGTGNTSSLYATADAVVQLIDGPLFYSAAQKTPWRTQAKKFSHRKK